MIAGMYVPGDSLPGHMGVQVPRDTIRGFHVSMRALFTFWACPGHRICHGPGPDQGRCVPAFPRKRLAQLRAESPACGSAVLYVWAGPKQGRIHAGQSQT
jgi:hypothetical protein